MVSEYSYLDESCFLETCGETGSQICLKVLEMFKPVGGRRQVQLLFAQSRRIQLFLLPVPFKKWRLSSCGLTWACWGGLLPPKETPRIVRPVGAHPRLACWADDPRPQGERPTWGCGRLGGPGSKRDGLGRAVPSLCRAKRVFRGSARPRCSHPKDWEPMKTGLALKRAWMASQQERGRASTQHGKTRGDGGGIKGCEGKEPTGKQVREGQLGSLVTGRQGKGIERRVEYKRGQPEGAEEVEGVEIRPIRRWRDGGPVPERGGA